MSQIKFKPGDRVVILAASYKGRVLTLLSQRDSGFWDVEENESGWNEKFFVHEHIYNSPLYQALS